MRVLDLFSGLGGFSAAFRDRGHTVVTVDIEERFKPTIRADVRTLRGEPGLFDLILASAPCTEYAPWGMPPTWNKRVVPDSSCVDAVWRLRGECQAPTILENVRGAVRWLGPPACHRGAQYLWGDVPPVFASGWKRGKGKWKLSPSPERTALRALIPYPLSLALCLAMEAGA